MNARSVIGWILGVGGLIALLAYVVPPLLWMVWFKTTAFGDWDTYEWNQKLTVTIETPEGERSGSAVTHVTVRLLRPGSESISAASANEYWSGEAVVVPLPSGQILFALLGRSQSGSWQSQSGIAQASFMKPVLGEDAKRIGGVASFYPKMKQYAGPPAIVPPGAYPRFVTFDDLSDPTSVKLVDPDDLAATFGPGYALKTVSLEITKEPVAYGAVEAVLPWIDEYYSVHFDGSRIESANAQNRLANSLGTGSFKTGN